MIYRLSLGVLACAALFAQSAYKRAPEAMRRILDAPATPVASVNPSKSHVLFLVPDRYPPIAELAQPMLRLAGMRINPRNNGPRTVTTFRAAELVDLQTHRRTALHAPQGASLGAPQWSPDGRHAAFLVFHDDRIELARLSLPAATLQPVGKLAVSAACGDALDWMADNKSLLVKLIPAGRPAAPAAPLVPAGPETQQTLGKASPAPTYQDLLQSDLDERLYDYYCTAQPAIVDAATGKASNAGPPAIYSNLSSSPNGRFLLATRIKRPFSRVLPESRFPADIEILDRNGKLVKTIASLPLADRIPLEGVRTGPRNPQWRPAEPATVAWVEALDGGNPKEKVPFRDRMMIAAAPFDSPRELLKTGERSMRASWMSDGRIWLNDYTRNTRTLRTFIAGPDGALAEFQSRNMQDRYRDLGTPITEPSPSGRPVVTVQNGAILTTGTGASPKGDRPFLDRIRLDTKEKTRLFESPDGCYETVVSVLDKDGARLLTRRESPTEPPNYFLLEGGNRTALTQITDPAPLLRQAKKQLITYERPDGVKLSMTLYLPPGYKEGTRLPAVLWAYPLDFSDADTAGQVSGSPHRFTTVAGASHLFLLLEGYAILDGATLPVIGTGESFNDTYIAQVVAGAKAAIDKADQLGVIDPKRVGVGGHSYGAFMTANLLAHSDLFAAGVARSGAYNRTLTPFGFQTERRTLWDTPETYLKMSPFMHAHKINEPILLIHGQADNNTGTFPIQSERMYTAVRGNGGTVRLVMLPHESHGYAARESVEHTLAETVAWFDRYVKNKQ
jgi:dipeptidyl aminopeptidase/acylaminoacyl peptidase